MFIKLFKYLIPEFIAKGHRLRSEKNKNALHPAIFIPTINHPCYTMPGIVDRRKHRRVM